MHEEGGGSGRGRSNSRVSGVRIIMSPAISTSAEFCDLLARSSDSPTRSASWKSRVLSFTPVRSPIYATRAWLPEDSDGRRTSTRYDAGQPDSSREFVCSSDASVVSRSSTCASASVCRLGPFSERLIICTEDTFDHAGNSRIRLSSATESLKCPKPLRRSPRNFLLIIPFASRLVLVLWHVLRDRSRIPVSWYRAHTTKACPVQCIPSPPAHAVQLRWVNLAVPAAWSEAMRAPSRGASASIF